jgi:basic membrane protein A
MPDVFIASAIADSGVAVVRAIEDLVAGPRGVGAIERIGLARPDAVRLTMSPAVAADTRQRIDALAGQIMDGAVTVPLTWDGPEFANPA